MDLVSFVTYSCDGIYMAIRIWSLSLYTAVRIYLLHHVYVLHHVSLVL